MNGGIPSSATLLPLISPMSPPKRIVSSTPRAIGSPALVMNTPAITAHSVMPVPIDRSIPPVMMTNVVPSASVPMTTVENRMLVMLE